VGGGQPLDASLREALTALGRLPDHWGDPRRAWAEPAASRLPRPSTSAVGWASRPRPGSPAGGTCGRC
jgi:hypothetical protein